MVKDIVVPPMGESISEGTIGRWIKKIGDMVRADDPLVEIETDKVTLEINAPVSGQLAEMTAVTGDVVRIGQVIGRMDEQGVGTLGDIGAATGTYGDVQPVQGLAQGAPSVVAASSVPTDGAPSPAKQLTMTVQKIMGSGKKGPATPQNSADEDRLSPAVRRLLSDRGIAPGQVSSPSGPGGRLLKADVMGAIDPSLASGVSGPSQSIPSPEPMVLTRLAEAATGQPTAPQVGGQQAQIQPQVQSQTQPQPQPIFAPVASPVVPPIDALFGTPASIPATPVTPPAEGPIRPSITTPAAANDLTSSPPPPPQVAALHTGQLTAPEQRVKMTRLRARIAERLKEAQNTAALLTTFNEIDMSHVMATRDAYKTSFQERFGVKLGFMSFFVKAAVGALKELPILNASVEGDEIVYKYHYDIGVAVSTPQGLVVPVVRDADHLSFADIEVAVSTLGQKAKNGKLSVDDLMGGTFTITNGGVFGSLMSTPIVNPPQSAILGMHKVTERPVVIDGRIEIRPMMYVALTYDHRIIDGREAVTFLVRIKDCLEDPKRLLLGV